MQTLARTEDKCALEIYADTVAVHAGRLYKLLGNGSISLGNAADGLGKIGNALEALAGKIKEAGTEARSIAAARAA